MDFGIGLSIGLSIERPVRRSLKLRMVFSKERLVLMTDDAMVSLSKSLEHPLLGSVFVSVLPVSQRIHEVVVRS